jgi:hypothetical protein
VRIGLSVECFTAATGIPHALGKSGGEQMRAA